MWANTESKCMEQKGFKGERRKEMIGGFSGTFDRQKQKELGFRLNFPDHLKCSFSH